MPRLGNWNWCQFPKPTPHERVGFTVVTSETLAFLSTLTPTQIERLRNLLDKALDIPNPVPQPEYVQRPLIPSIFPSDARVGDIVFLSHTMIEAECVITAIGSVCDDLFNGLEMCDLGRDATHTFNYAVAAEMVAKGTMYISRSGEKPEYDEL